MSNANGEIVTQTTEELQTARLKPFKYRHLGSFAYVGDNQAVLQLPVIGMGTPAFMYSTISEAIALSCVINVHSKSILYNVVHATPPFVDLCYTLLHYM